ncbi:hypothetical protein D3C76_1309020 [compost metagenome]
MEILAIDVAKSIGSPKAIGNNNLRISLRILGICFSISLGFNAFCRGTLNIACFGGSVTAICFSPAGSSTPRIDNKVPLVDVKSL